MGGSEGLRHRAAAAAPEPPVQEDPSVTPEQRKVVQQILAAKSFYEVMGVAKDASEADIKSAYKKVSQCFQHMSCIQHVCVVVVVVGGGGQGGRAGSSESVCDTRAAQGGAEQSGC
jgi:hypothetical protein